MRRRLVSQGAFVWALACSLMGCDGYISVSGDIPTADIGTNQAEISVDVGADQAAPDSVALPDSSVADTALWSDIVKANDTSVAVDTSTPPDTSQPDPCAQVSCPANSACVAGGCVCDSGYQMSNGSCVPEDPCQAVSCGTNAQCIAGTCSCVPGFVDQAGQCVVPDPSDPAARTKQQVCVRWNADYPTQASTIYDPGAGLAACDPGTIDPIAHDDAMRRLNLYRWLLGLDPAGVNWDNQAKTQAAALMMHANGTLSHSPPTSWECYSAAGASGAGSSNLSMGRSHPANTIDDYIQDRSSFDLGHRRWCFNPSLDAVGFGQYGSGGAMWAFGTGSHPEPDFVAYPGPGPFPASGLYGVWSFHRRQAFGSPQVTVTRVSDGYAMVLTSALAGSTYGWLATLRIELTDPVQAGESYLVAVTDGANTWTYTTTIVDCNTP